MDYILRITSALLVLLVSSSGLSANENAGGKSGYVHSQGQSFAGPGSTTAQLEEDDEVKAPTFRFEAFDRALESWFQWKGKLREDTGLQLGVAYTALYQSADNAPTGVEDSAGSGILRLSGSWELYRSESGATGKLVMSADHRHAYTEIPPADLGFETGYLGIPGLLFNDGGAILGDLNWQQSINGGRGGILLGRYDPNDFLDVLGYANPWTTFQNLYILSNASIALPDWGTGVGIGNWFGEQWYGIGSVSDANGVASEEKLFEDFGELYSTAEIGWSPSRDRRYLNNIHATFWHADYREEANVEESEGVSIGANWTFSDTLMVFFKGGKSEGSAPLLNDSITLGGIYYFPYRSDLVGLAVNHGSPSDQSLDDQTTTELFYRIQFAQNLALTPSIQWISDPALNPEESEVWYAGLRMRVSY